MQASRKSNYNDSTHQNTETSTREKTKKAPVRQTNQCLISGIMTGILTRPSIIYLLETLMKYPTGSRMCTSIVLEYYKKAKKA